jgi:hypothetical protein
MFVIATKADLVHLTIVCIGYTLKNFHAAIRLRSDESGRMWYAMRIYFHVLPMKSLYCIGFKAKA